MHVPLFSDGQVAAYVWALRTLTVKEHNIGGPTIGVEVGNEEVLRFDCHDTPGHWHVSGYDRLGAPAILARTVTYSDSRYIAPKDQRRR